VVSSLPEIRKSPLEFQWMVFTQPAWLARLPTSFRRGTQHGSEDAWLRRERGVCVWKETTPWVRAPHTTRAERVLTLLSQQESLDTPVS